MSKNALEHSLFPIGDLTKPEVRELAKKFGLVTATKKESMGICFVGKVGIKDFLLHELGPQKGGDIMDQKGHVIGHHDGAIFYTIGQRHGLDVGGGLPYYVTAKDMKKNIVYVTTNLDDDKLWTSELKLDNLHWISAVPEVDNTYQVRTRHRAALVPAKVVSQTKRGMCLNLEEPIRAATSGQSAVVYDGQLCLGGGIIS